MKRDLYNLNLLAKLMVLLHQILFNMAIAAVAVAILMRISAEQAPFLNRVAHVHSNQTLCDIRDLMTCISP